MEMRPTQHPWRENERKTPPQIPENGWPEVQPPASAGISASPAGRREKKEPCRFVMERLRAEFGLEFIYARLSKRGRFRVMDHALLVLKWEESGPRKIREIDRILARKVPGPLSRKYSPSGAPEASSILDAEADEFDDVADLTTILNGHHSPEE